MTLCELLEEDQRDIILALIPNIRTLIEKYCNEHGLNKLPDPPSNGDTTPNGSHQLTHANTVQGGKFQGQTDFSSMQRKYEINPKQGFGGGYRKMPTNLNL